MNICDHGLYMLLTFKNNDVCKYNISRYIIIEDYEEGIMSLIHKHDNDIDISYYKEFDINGYFERNKDYIKYIGKLDNYDLTYNINRVANFQKFDQLVYEYARKHQKEDNPIYKVPVAPMTSRRKGDIIVYDDAVFTVSDFKALINSAYVQELLKTNTFYLFTNNCTKGIREGNDISKAIGKIIRFSDDLTHAYIQITNIDMISVFKTIQIDNIYVDFYFIIDVIYSDDIKVVHPTKIEFPYIKLYPSSTLKFKDTVDNFVGNPFTEEEGNENYNSGKFNKQINQLHDYNKKSKLESNIDSII